MPDPVVVIGAGPAGMSAAWQLARRGAPVVVLERDSVVGGLAKTVSHWEGFCYDYGPHTFHIRETETSRWIVTEIKSLLGRQYTVLGRGTRLFLQGKYLAYPPKFQEVLRKVRVGLGFRIVWDYLYASIRYALHPPQQEDSFEDWGVRNLGRTLYDTFFGIYSEKVWGIPMSQVSSRQAQRVAKLNLKNIILRMFKVKADPDTYFVEYLYPHGGIGTLYRRMAEETKARGGVIHLKATATRIETDEQRIRAVVYEQDGQKHTVFCNHLVSTLPLTELTAMMTPALPPTILAGASGLHYRSLILIFLRVNRSWLTDYHWCYLIEPQFACNRFSEQKNVSPDLLPEQWTVLCVEAGCEYGDDRWQMADESLAGLAIQDMVAMGILKAGEVEGHAVVRIRHAYPIYKLGFEQKLHDLLEHLHQFDNFYTIGRHGLYMNNSMDENVEMGMRVAEHIAQAESRGVWWQNVLKWTQLEDYGR